MERKKKEREKDNSPKLWTTSTKQVTTRTTTSVQLEQY